MRYLLLILLIFIFITSIFEISFQLIEKKFSTKIEAFNKVTAINVEFLLFKNDKLSWKIKGFKAIFVDDKYISVINFFARNGQNNLKVTANRAKFLLKEKRIILQGDVYIKLKKNKQVEEIKTDKAIIDLKNNIIYSYKPILIKQNGNITRGVGFKFFIQSGKLILDEAQSYFNPS